MSQHVLIPVDDGTGLVLPPDVLAALGVKVGDSVDLTVTDHQIVLRPLGEAARRRQLTEGVRALLTRRRGLYQALTGGGRQ
jgi:bifunctional DNA-binding transcriptional regulator/antitoxin component of YhaV-PrlF toxin-antitoxin module